MLFRQHVTWTDSGFVVYTVIYNVDCRTSHFSWHLISLMLVVHFTQLTAIFIEIVIAECVQTCCHCIREKIAVIAEEMIPGCNHGTISERQESRQAHPGNELSGHEK